MKQDLQKTKENTNNTLKNFKKLINKHYDLVQDGIEKENQEGDDRIFRLENNKIVILGFDEPEDLDYGPLTDFYKDKVFGVLAKRLFNDLTPEIEKEKGE